MGIAIAIIFSVLFVVAVIALRLKSRPRSATMYQGWYQEPQIKLVNDETTGKQFVRFTLQNGSARWLVPTGLLLCYWAIYTYYWGDRSLLETDRQPPEFFLIIAITMGAMGVWGWRNLIGLFRKIDVYPDHLVIRNLVSKSEPYEFALLTEFSAAKGTPKSRPSNCVSYGVLLRFKGSKPLKILATMHGYKDLIERLAETNAEMQKVLPTSYEAVKPHIER